MISLTDTGTGIPPDVTSHIFEPFSAAELNRIIREILDG
jgi:signal transduction histidine kinase